MGAARTALLAWVRARRSGGAFIVRFEDLDRERVREGSQRAILEDLAWLGLDFDEGPGRPGAAGSCIQSARTGLYEAAFLRLKARGLLYPCTCSRREIARSASAPHGEDEPAYPGTCRSGAAHPGRPQAWRFRMERAQPFKDALAGDQAGVRDDFVVRRADGAFAYQLACAVDDAAMGVSEVVRGADLLGSASRQQALHLALGQDPPAWLHVPLMLGPDGARLSKRHASVAVSAYRDAGWSAPQLLGLLAGSLQRRDEAPRHSWLRAPSAAQLAERLDPLDIPPEASRFDGPWPGDQIP